MNVNVTVNNGGDQRSSGDHRRTTLPSKEMNETDSFTKAFETYSYQRHKYKAKSIN